MASHCLVNGTKVRGALLTKGRGGLLWLLPAWSIALKCAEHYLLKCAEVLLLLSAWSIALKGAEGLYG